jgi:hypothetical protein
MFIVLDMKAGICAVELDPVGTDADPQFTISELKLYAFVTPSLFDWGIASF